MRSQRRPTGRAATMQSPALRHAAAERRTSHRCRAHRGIGTAGMVCDRPRRAPARTVSVDPSVRRGFPLVCTGRPGPMPQNSRTAKPAPAALTGPDFADDARRRMWRGDCGGAASGRPDNDPSGDSLRLLPSGPDRVGEAPVRRRPPGLHIGCFRRDGNRDRPATDFAGTGAAVAWATWWRSAHGGAPAPVGQGHEPNLSALSCE